MKHHTSKTTAPRSTGINAIMASYINLVTIVLVIFLSVIASVRTLPNEKQAQELLLLDTLGKRGGVGSGGQDSLMDMLGRSESIVYYTIFKCKLGKLITTIYNYCN